MITFVSVSLIPEFHEITMDISAAIKIRNVDYMFLEGKFEFLLEVSIDTAQSSMLTRAQP